MTTGLLHQETPTDSRQLMILRALRYDEAEFATTLPLRARYPGRKRFTWKLRGLASF